MVSSRNAIRTKFLPEKVATPLKVVARLQHVNVLVSRRQPVDCHQRGAAMRHGAGQGGRHPRQRAPSGAGAGVPPGGRRGATRGRGRRRPGVGLGPRRRGGGDAGAHRVGIRGRRAARGGGGGAGRAPGGAVRHRVDGRGRHCAGHGRGQYAAMLEPGGFPGSGAGTLCMTHLVDLCGQALRHVSRFKIFPSQSILRSAEKLTALRK